MAYGKIKADAIIRDTGSGDEEITMATIVGLDSNKASLTGATFTGDIILNAQEELRLADADSSNYIALKSGATVGTNSTWTLPTDAPVANDVLTVTSVSSNNPTLEWAAASGGKVLGSTVFTDFTRTALSARTAFTNLFTISYNKQSSTSKLFVWGQTQGFGQNSGGTVYQMRYAGGTLVNGCGSFTYPGGGYGNLIAWAGVISSSSTGSNNIEVGHAGAGNNYAQSVLHPQQSDHGDFTNGIAGTHILVMEVEV